MKQEVPSVRLEDKDGRFLVLPDGDDVDDYVDDVVEAFGLQRQTGEPRDTSH